MSLVACWYRMHHSIGWIIDIVSQVKVWCQVWGHPPGFGQWKRGQMPIVLWLKRVLKICFNTLKVIEKKDFCHIWVFCLVASDTKTCWWFISICRSVWRTNGRATARHARGFSWGPWWTGRTSTEETAPWFHPQYCKWTPQNLLCCFASLPALTVCLKENLLPFL